MDQTTKPSPLRRMMAATRSAFSVLAGSGTSKSKLADPLPPKTVKAGASSVPTMFDRAKPDATTAMRETDRNTATIDLTTLRTSTTKKAIQEFAAVNPELSASVDGYVRAALTDYTIKVFNRLDGSFNADATRTANQWLNTTNAIGNYEEGYAPMRSLTSIAESMAVELRLFGACSMELVLDKARLPWFMMPVGVRDLKWYPDKSGKWAAPVQVVGGEEISLDIPTFFYTSLDQSLYTAYSNSPLEAALQPVLFGLQFINDVRRVVRAAIHPRVKITLNSEELRKLMPPDLAATAEGVQAFMTECITSVADQINGLEPEDALVVLDTMEVDILDRGNTSLDTEYQALVGMIDASISSGSKTLPAILGKGGNQTTASVQSMLFLMSVRGAIQNKLNELFSRALTLALRLLGQDVYVEFRFKDINLRPELELEAFTAQKQSRVLELLSLGFLSDEEASIELTGKLPSGNLTTPLSGTGFFNAAPVQTGNPYSNTGAGGNSTGTGGALNKTLTPSNASGKRGDQGSKGNQGSNGSKSGKGNQGGSGNTTQKGK